MSVQCDVREQWVQCEQSREVPYIHQLNELLIGTKFVGNEVRASQLAQASERVGSPIPASQQG